MKNKRRAWIALAASLWLNFICQQYFFGEVFVTELFTPRHSFIYCLPLFITGGLVYLYVDEIRAVCGKFRWIVLGVCNLSIIAYFLVESWMSYAWQYYILLPVFMLWLSYAVGVEVPKPLVKVNGVRMIDTVADGLRENGIDEIYVVVGLLKEQFHEWGDERDWHRRSWFA